VLAPAWPGMDGDIEELRRDPSGIGHLGIREIVDHYAAIICGLDRQPIVMGHSFGGAFTQILLDRGLGAARVAIDSAAVKGILRLPTQGRTLYEACPNQGRTAAAPQPDRYTKGRRPPRVAMHGFESLKRQFRRVPTLPLARVFLILQTATVAAGSTAAEHVGASSTKTRCNIHRCSPWSSMPSCFHSYRYEIQVGAASQSETVPTNFVVHPFSEIRMQDLV